jgi:hypothetical protein
MTIQPPSFSFGRNKRDDVDDGGARDNEATRADAEKTNSPSMDRTPSVSSFNSDERKTFGVAKVEAVTSVWTKKSLIVLYILYSSVPQLGG